MFRIRTTIGAGVATGGGLSTIYAGGAGAVDGQNAVDRVRDFWAALTTGFSSQLTWTVLGTLDVVDPVTGQITAQENVTSRSGAATGGGGGQVPTGVQCQIDLRTGIFLNGRRLVGRIAVPGLLQTQAGNLGPTGVAVTQLNAAGLALLGAPTPGIVVWSRRWGTTSPIVSATLDPGFKFLRSRRD